MDFNTEFKIKETIKYKGNYRIIGKMMDESLKNRLGYVYINEKTLKIAAAPDMALIKMITTGGWTFVNAELKGKDIKITDSSESALITYRGRINRIADYELEGKKKIVVLGRIQRDGKDWGFRLALGTGIDKIEYKDVPTDTAIGLASSSSYSLVNAKLIKNVENKKPYIASKKDEFVLIEQTSEIKQANESTLANGRPVNKYAKPSNRGAYAHKKFLEKNVRNFTYNKNHLRFVKKELGSYAVLIGVLNNLSDAKDANERVNIVKNNVCGYIDISNVILPLRNPSSKAKRVQGLEFNTCMIKSVDMIIDELVPKIVEISTKVGNKLITENAKYIETLAKQVDRQKAVNELLDTKIEHCVSIKNKSRIKREVRVYIDDELFDLMLALTVHNTLSSIIVGRDGYVEAIHKLLDFSYDSNNDDINKHIKLISKVIRSSSRGKSKFNKLDDDTKAKMYNSLVEACKHWTAKYKSKLKNYKLLSSFFVNMNVRIVNLKNTYEISELIRQTYKMKFNTEKEINQLGYTLNVSPTNYDGNIFLKDKSLIYIGKFIDNSDAKLIRYTCLGDLYSWASALNALKAGANKRAEIILAVQSIFRPDIVKQFILKYSEQYPALDYMLPYVDLDKFTEYGDIKEQFAVYYASGYKIIKHSENYIRVEQHQLEVDEPGATTNFNGKAAYSAINNVLLLPEYDIYYYNVRGRFLNEELYSMLAPVVCDLVSADVSMDDVNAYIGGLRFAL